jgi:hypothetical protein
MISRNVLITTCEQCNKPRRYEVRRKYRIILEIMKQLWEVNIQQSFEHVEELFQS